MRLSTNIFCYKFTNKIQGKDNDNSKELNTFAKTFITMKLNKRKFKYSFIFFICWFALLAFLVDVVLKFQTLVDYFGSYALTEISLLLIVLLPTLAVYKCTKDKTESCL